jgi:hypothetical protein
MENDEANNDPDAQEAEKWCASLHETKEAAAVLAVHKAKVWSEKFNLLAAGYLRGNPAFADSVDHDDQ